MHLVFRCVLTCELYAAWPSGRLFDVQTDLGTRMLLNRKSVECSSVDTIIQSMCVRQCALEAVKLALRNLLLSLQVGSAPLMKLVVGAAAIPHYARIYSFDPIRLRASDGRLAAWYVWSHAAYHLLLTLGCMSGCQLILTRERHDCEEAGVCRRL